MFQRLVSFSMFRVMVIAVLASYIAAVPVQSGFAQTMLPMPPPGQRVYPTGHFTPALMSGLKVDPKDPFSFTFIMDRARQAMPEEMKKEEYLRLIKYFLTSLTIPNEDMWVNLSPFEAGRMISDNFGRTEMGRELLMQDYVLKQFTASLMYPEEHSGKVFWKKVYQKVYERFGAAEVPLEVFNKVWITADRADIFHKNDTALLLRSHLKVQLERDFLAEHSQHRPQTAPSIDSAQSMAADIVRDGIVPLIEKEANEGENFARVRQIVSAMIMATWFKKMLRQTLLGQVYADKNRTGGIEAADLRAGEKVYLQYMEAYKRGVFDFVREEVDPVSKDILPRRYFAGGFMALNDVAMVVDEAQAASIMKEAGGTGAVAMRKDLAQVSLLSIAGRLARPVLFATMMGLSALSGTAGAMENVPHGAISMALARQVEGLGLEALNQVRAGVLAAQLQAGDSPLDGQDPLAIGQMTLKEADRLQAGLDQLSQTVEGLERANMEFEAAGEAGRRDPESLRFKQRMLEKSIPRVQQYMQKLGTLKGVASRVNNGLSKVVKTRSAAGKTERARISQAFNRFNRAIDQQYAAAWSWLGVARKEMKQVQLDLASPLPEAALEAPSLVHIVNYGERSGPIDVTRLRPPDTGPIVISGKAQDTEVDWDKLLIGGFFSFPVFGVGWIGFADWRKANSEREQKEREKQRWNSLTDETRTVIEAKRARLVVLTGELVHAQEDQSRAAENMAAKILLREEVERGFTEAEDKGVWGEALAELKKHRASARRAATRAKNLAARAKAEQAMIEWVMQRLKDEIDQLLAQGSGTDTGAVGDQLGGISLSDKDLVIRVNVDDRGLPLAMPLQDPAMLNVTGFVPLIRAIVPATPGNMPVLSELIRNSTLKTPG